MPDTDGVTLLREWGASGLLTMPVVMMSGHGTIETAVEATSIGAFDFLEKPIGLSKLLATIARALKSAAAKEPRRVSLAALGSGAAIREVERALEALVAARQPVLILGEPGTGPRRRGARARTAPTRRSSCCDRRAAHRQSAAADRGGARRRPLPAGDRPVRQARAEGAVVPAVEARAAQRDAGRDERRAARQPRGRRPVRPGAAVAASRRAR